MSTHVNAEGGKDFETLPNGLYIARCYRIIDLGTQIGSPQYGSKQQKKISISWEILDDPKMEDGRPFSVHKTYTASLNEKATLRADLESWRNKDFTDTELADFDLAKILGAYCQIQVALDETGKYSNIQSIVAMKGDKPKPVNENVLFDIDEPDMAVFDKLSDTMKQKIQSSPEWQEHSRPKASKQVDDVVIEDTEEEINLDDIPF